MKSIDAVHMKMTVITLQQHRFLVTFAHSCTLHELREDFVYYCVCCYCILFQDLFVE